MKQNKKIAITGGIGSGKSTVLKMLEEKGYKVFSCDKIYAQLIADKNFAAKICQRFGDVSDGYGGIDRKKLSDIVFKDKSALSELNKITHPEIYKEMFRQAEEAGGLCFCEVPLLFESGAEALFDGVIVILRDEEERIKSVAARDNLPENEVLKRISNQYNYTIGDFEEYYVIHNNGNLAALSDQLDSLIIKLKEKYGRD